MSTPKPHPNLFSLEVIGKMNSNHPPISKKLVLEGAFIQHIKREAAQLTFRQYEMKKI